MELNVVTFNIRHGRGTDGRVDLPRIAEVIERSGADIVGLNEVDKCFSYRSGYADQLTWLSERLGMHGVFGAAVTLKGTAELRQYGNALLSRYPVVSQANHPYPTRARWFEGRALLEAGIAVNGQRVKLYVTHLSLNPLSQRRQIDTILNKMAEERSPVVLMGDCNMRPGTKPWQKVSVRVHDVCRSAGGAAFHTFPSRRPKMQLDYIFVSPWLGISAVQVIADRPDASDHLPLKATLRLSE